MPRSTSRTRLKARIAAQEAAQRTVAEVEVIRLSLEAQEKFATLLLNPPAPAPALKKVFDRHRSLVVE